jgi:hypothetical protein
MANVRESKIRRWTSFTPPQNTALAAFCGLFLLWRSYYLLNKTPVDVETVVSIQIDCFFHTGQA